MYGDINNSRQLHSEYVIQLTTDCKQQVTSRAVQHVNNLGNGIPVKIKAC